MASDQQQQGTSAVLETNVMAASSQKQPVSFVYPWWYLDADGAAKGPVDCWALQRMLLHGEKEGHTPLIHAWIGQTTLQEMVHGRGSSDTAIRRQQPQQQEQTTMQPPATGAAPAMPPALNPTSQATMAAAAPLEPSPLPGPPSKSSPEPAPAPSHVLPLQPAPSPAPPSIQSHADQPPKPTTATVTVTVNSSNTGDGLWDYDDGGGDFNIDEPDEPTNEAVNLDLPPEDAPGSFAPAAAQPPPTAPSLPPPLPPPAAAGTATGKGLGAQPSSTTEAATGTGQGSGAQPPTTQPSPVKKPAFLGKKLAVAAPPQPGSKEQGAQPSGAAAGGTATTGQKRVHDALQPEQQQQGQQASDPDAGRKKARPSPPAPAPTVGAAKPAGVERGGGGVTGGDTGAGLEDDVSTEAAGRQPKKQKHKRQASTDDSDESDDERAAALPVNGKKSGKEGKQGGGKPDDRGSKERSAANGDARKAHQSERPSSPTGKHAHGAHASRDGPGEQRQPASNNHAGVSNSNANKQALQQLASSKAAKKTGSQTKPLKKVSSGAYVDFEDLDEDQPAGKGKGTGKETGKPGSKGLSKDGAGKADPSNSSKAKALGAGAGAAGGSAGQKSNGGSTGPSKGGTAGPSAQGRPGTTGTQQQPGAKPPAAGGANAKPPGGGNVPGKASPIAGNRMAGKPLVGKPPAKAPGIGGLFNMMNAQRQQQEREAEAQRRRERRMGFFADQVYDKLSPEVQERRQELDYEPQFQLVDKACARAPADEEKWWGDEFDIYTLYDLVNERIIPDDTMLHVPSGRKRAVDALRDNQPLISLMKRFMETNQMPAELLTYGLDVNEILMADQGNALGLDDHDSLPVPAPVHNPAAGGAGPQGRPPLGRSTSFSFPMRDTPRSPPQSLSPQRPTPEQYSPTHQLAHPAARGLLRQSSLGQGLGQQWSGPLQPQGQVVAIPQQQSLIFQPIPAGMLPPHLAGMHGIPVHLVQQQQVAQQPTPAQAPAAPQQPAASSLILSLLHQLTGQGKQQQGQAGDKEGRGSGAEGPLAPATPAAREATASQLYSNIYKQTKARVLRVARLSEFMLPEGASRPALPPSDDDGVPAHILELEARAYLEANEDEQARLEAENEELGMLDSVEDMQIDDVPLPPPITTTTITPLVLPAAHPPLPPPQQQSLGLGSQKRSTPAETADDLLEYMTITSVVPEGGDGTGVPPVPQPSPHPPASTGSTAPGHTSGHTQSHTSALPHPPAASPGLPAVQQSPSHTALPPDIPPHLLPPHIAAKVHSPAKTHSPMPPSPLAPPPPMPQQQQLPIDHQQHQPPAQQHQPQHHHLSSHAPPHTQHPPHVHQQPGLPAHHHHPPQQQQTPFAHAHQQPSHLQPHHGHHTPVEQPLQLQGGPGPPAAAIHAPHPHAQPGHGMAVQHGHVPAVQGPPVTAPAGHLPPVPPSVLHAPPAAVPPVPLPTQQHQGLHQGPGAVGGAPTGGAQEGTAAGGGGGSQPPDAPTIPDEVLMAAFGFVPRELKVGGPAAYDQQAFEFVVQSLQQVDQYGAQGQYSQAAALLFSLHANGHLVYLV